MKALVTGGCGFIGSHAVRALVTDGWQVVNLDALTYASNPANLADLADTSAYTFVQGSICDAALVERHIPGCDLVINFAAETHVDRSLLEPASFVRTDVEGVVCLLEVLRGHPGTAFVHMSTDEVFGSLPEPLRATEDTPFAPGSPYSASKAAAELQLRAYAQTYGMPITVLRSCNIYGPNQHIEKFIPLFATRALAGDQLPLYGDGLQEREWLFIDDFVSALRTVIRAFPATPGVSAYHVGSDDRRTNVSVARTICELSERPFDLIQPVEDRPGHDRRYALDCSRLRAMGWAPRVSFEDGLARTVAWYRDQQDHWRAAESAGFAEYMQRQYASRLDAR